MDSKEFVKAYSRTAFDENERRPDNATFERAENYSEFFGMYLHDYLNGTPNQESFTNLLGIARDYVSFVYTDLRDYEIKLFDQNKDYGFKRLNHINYHWLNTAMIGMWELLFAEEQATDEVRKRMIRDTQDILAFNGSEQYTWKDRLADQKNDYEYFAEHMKNTRSTVEGRLNERDVAIVLLDFAAQNPGHIVLPGPIQFERHAAPNTDDDTNHNADFIVIDMQNRRSVGIQTKSFFSRQETVDKYDPERIVCIDGAMDLANRRAVRTKNGSSRESQVSWAGMIAADHMRNIHSFGRNVSILMQIYPHHTVLAKKIDAKVRLGSTKVDRRGVANIIAPRILEKL